MLLKTFFIILAAFLVYYFGFYTDSEKTISGEQTTQNHQLWNAKKINFQISLGDNQYLLKANAAEVLNKNKKKYFIQMPEFALQGGWSIQAQQALLENKNLELLKNIKGKWKDYLLLAKKINIRLDKKEIRLQGDFSIINNEKKNNSKAKKIKLSSKEALLKNNVIILPKRIIVQFGKNSLQANEGILEKDKLHLKGNIIAQLETGNLQADEGILEKDRLHLKGNITAQLEEGELQADEGILEKDRLHLKGNITAQLEEGELQADEGILEKDKFHFTGNAIVQSKEITIQSQEIIYLPTKKILQSQKPFRFIKKGEDINIEGNSFLYDITKKSLQLKE